MPTPKSIPKTQQLVEVVAKLLSPTLVPLGFEYFPKLNHFRRTGPVFSDYITLSTFRDVSGKFQISLICGVRFEEVEKSLILLAPPLKPDAHSKTIVQISANVGPTLAAVHPVSGKWWVDEKFDMEEITEQMPVFVKGYILPWLEAHHDINKVHSALMLWPGDATHSTPSAHQRAVVIDLLSKDGARVVKSVEAIEARVELEPEVKSKFQSFAQKLKSANPEIFAAAQTT